jgi:murein DD-endopeptidase MepM/ murein hydrolase activator NlpD
MKAVVFIFILVLGFAGCTNSPETAPTEAAPTAQTLAEYEPVLGCDGQIYNDPATSPYILPFAVGASYPTGLTNCSTSFHGPGTPDQYASDFDMPEGTPFIAARAGTVYEVVEDQSSTGGGAGNYVTIDHGDNTYAKYYHSPKDGIDVEVGDEVAQGDVLGITGRSGLAGYPHLHFIVVKDQTEFPYEGIAVSFRNAIPADVALESYSEYEAAPYE